MDEEMGLKGGQGRTPAEIATAAAPVAVLCACVLGLVAAMVVCILTGCQPSARPTMGVEWSEDDPRDRPAPHELKHVCPM
jgi:ABC-type uncharacterized transport system auxiliary subunit